MRSNEILEHYTLKAIQHSDPSMEKTDIVPEEWTKMKNIFCEFIHDWNNHLEKVAKKHALHIYSLNQRRARLEQFIISTHDDEAMERAEGELKKIHAEITSLS